MANFFSDLKTTVGFDTESKGNITPAKDWVEFINLNLSALGEPIFGEVDQYPTLKMGQALLAHYRAKEQLRDRVRPPVDHRIEDFLLDYLKDVDGKDLELPGKTFHLHQHGLARMLSLPADGDMFRSDIVSSYRLANGILNNPKEDRRTTKGVFHVTEGGLPVPNDKKAVPKATFLKLYKAALNPPRELLQLPFTSSQNPEKQAHLWVSLMLRPVVCPEVAGFTSEKRMEVRFFAPGNLISNLDFVESIFGNAGDPYLGDNNSALDPEHWSGHTGCVILAPHLIRLKKKDVGLPHISEATDRQKRDSMCWESPDELYNDGGAFKLTLRDHRGVVVTLIADNYYGYCKKEVKTQISYAANLHGLCEEEHAGGAVTFTSYDLGEDFRLADRVTNSEHTFKEVIEKYGDHIELQSQGYGVDKKFPNILYLPEDAAFSLRDQNICWGSKEGKREIKLLSGKVYMMPYGYKVRLVKPAEGRRWRLIGTVPQSTVCHKPCTVSGGGKSEISKSIADAIIHAPFYVESNKDDLAAVDGILKKEYGSRFRDSSQNKPQGRPILSPERSLGSVIKLLTPHPDFSDEHNEFIQSIPSRIKDLTLLVKRFYKDDWGDNWCDRFSVDIINGISGHELKYRGNKVITSYLRVGYAPDGSWRVFSLRKDFAPAAKIQAEDDITTSVVAPVAVFGAQTPDPEGLGAKIIYNCEYRLFQRPDDAIIRGYDKKAELDISRKGNFLSNYQPLTRTEAQEMIEDAVRFDYFTDPMKKMIRDFVENPENNPEFMVSSAHPRLVDGKPSKNPRYLQNRSTLEAPDEVYIAEMGKRFYRRLKASEPAFYPVSAVLTGRRNNPPEQGIKSLAVFNPIHYLPLPEAFMEFISSMTGKSPSTTGAGSEGALTKGPFNALLPITDLNNALVSFAVTNAHPFVTAAGNVGPKFRVDHDISLLVPEIWCRMRPYERNPKWLIEHGFLEEVPEVEYNGKPLKTHLLGYRITRGFVLHFLGRIFTNPELLFTDEMLKPELQGDEVFAEGMENIWTTHQNVASHYFEDGAVELACPPLKALLNIMAKGEYNGLTLRSPDLRKMFDREVILGSDWYQERLVSCQQREIHYLKKLQHSIQSGRETMDTIPAKLEWIQERLEKVQSSGYVKGLVGTIGRDPGLPIG